MMNLRLSFSYARRDMRGGMRGLWIFLICLVLGVGAIAAVQSTARGMIESLRYDGRYILGGDISLRTVYQPATPEQLRFLRKNIGPVNTVMETRTMARPATASGGNDGSDNNRAGRSLLVELKAVDPFYPLYGSLSFADDAGQPLDKTTQDLLLPTPHGPNAPENDDWGAVVEKEVLTQMNLRLGDSMMIGQRPFIIRGVITKEPDRISRARFTLAPRVMISSFIFDATGLSARGNQVYYDHRIVVPYAKTPADMALVEKTITDAFPGAAWKGRTCFNATPQIERMIGQITQFMTLIALTTLLVGGVGISNAVRAFLTSRRVQIATLKSLGASSGFVFRTYLFTILTVCLAGIVVGCAAGHAAATAAIGLLTERLALSGHTRFYPEAMAIAAGFGLLTTLCFSLWPLGRACAIRPRQLFRDVIDPADEKPSLNIRLSTLIFFQLIALLTLTTSTNMRLALGFICSTAVVFAVFYLYARVVRHVAASPFFQRLSQRKIVTRLAVSNLYRPGNLTATVVLSLGLGLTVLSCVALVEYNVNRLMRDDIGRNTPSFFFLDIPPDQTAAFEKTIHAFDGARDFIMTPSLRGRIVRINDTPAEKAIVDPNEAWVTQSDRGFTYAARLPAESRIVEGDWWAPDYQGPPIVSISTDVARAFDIGVGDRLTVNIMGSDITAAVANVREVQWSSFSMNFAITFAPGFLEKIPSMRMATVVVADTAAETALQDRIAAEFPGVTTIRVKTALDTAGSFMRNIADAMRAGAGLTLLAGAFVLAGALAASRQRYIYDAVVLKVLGARQGQILQVFMLEYGALALITALIAAGLGTLGAFLVVTFVMKISWAFGLLPVLKVMTLALGLSLTAGYFGTRQALLQKPAVFLRHA